MMLLGGGHNPAAFHEVDGRRIAHDETLVAGAVDGSRAGNDQVGVAVETTTDAARSTPGSRRSRPSRTPRPGFELVYQGSCVLLHRQVELGARGVGDDPRRAASDASTAGPRDRGGRGAPE